MLLFDAHHLAFSYPGMPLFQDLSLAIGPGLTLVRGGDGCGKTTLLRLIAGQLAPQAGNVRTRATPLWYETPSDPAHDAKPARAWLQARLDAHPGADAAGLADQIHAFGLAEHIDKPLYMLSTGSRRKLGLVGAAACRAPLVLLDTPFAALDTPSARAVTALLLRAARDQGRAWIVADYELPRGISPDQLAGTVDLGDEPGAAPR